MYIHMKMQIVKSVEYLGQIIKLFVKSIKSEEFFRLLAVNSGISDLDVVKRVFYGMIKTISRELKEKQHIKLPDWGEFTLKIHKSRQMRDVNTGQLMTIPAKATVKFTPDYKVKHYFYELGNEGL